MNNNTDNNHQFIIRNMQQKLHLCKDEISQRRRQLACMDIEDRYEWAEMMALKCQANFIGNLVTPDLMKIVIPLVMLSKQFQYKYNAGIVENILKYAYVQETGGKKTNSQILRLFRQYNFNIRQFQILQYEDPWYNKVYRWFTD